MKKYFTITAIAIIIALGSCDKEVHESKETLCHEATAIADSINDVDRLKSHIARFDALKEKRAALILRQKLGSTLRNRSHFDSAVVVHETCLRIAEEIEDTLQMIIALNNQGTNFRRIGELEEASVYHYRALELCDKTSGDTSYISRKNRVRTLNGLGNVMLSLGNDEVAEEMFRRALKGEEELGSATGQAINYANIGAIKERNDDIDSARIYYNWSMQKNIEADNRIGISLCYQNLGNLDETESNLTAARDNYLKSYELGLQSKDVWHWLNSCTALGRLNIKEGNIAEAQRYNDEALEAAQRIGAKGRLSNLYYQQAAIHEMRGEYRKALESTRLSAAYKDSADLEEDRVYTQNMRVNYEVNKRKEEVEKAIADAEHEKEIRNMVIWSCIIILLLILVAVIALIRSVQDRKRANRLLERTNQERQEFYRGITHQLRTPLTVIIGMMHELKRFIPTGNDLAQKEFSAVTRKSDQLLTLVNEMIEYNRGERVNVELNELAKNESTKSSDDNTPANSDLQTWKNDLHEYVLVAEDDEDVALLITQMLKNEGYCYHWAENGKEALEMIAENQPQLIITDIMMPQMDGIELIKNIRADENTNHIPIIVVSARTENNDRLIGLDAGAEVYLGKPFIPDELLIMVRKLIEQRELLRKKYGQQIEEADKIDNCETIKGINKSEQEFIKEINEYIRENIMDCNLNAAMLAAHMIMSVTTLNRKINSITGNTTTNYIRQRKLARAKYLLRNSGMSMGEIQAVCGFETPSYFSRTFKSEFGITPTEYRRGQ